MKSIVIIPTYNEKDNLEPLLSQIWTYVPDLHVLVVDDNSPDGTGQLANELQSRSPDKLFILHRSGKGGLGAAYKHAFSHVIKQKYDVVIQMDADLSHDPASLPLFLEAIANADLVLGTRYRHGVRVLNWDFKRLLLSKVATRFVNVMTGLPFSDVTGGYKCWRRSALEGIDLSSVSAKGYLFQVETTFEAYRQSLAIAELPITFHERRVGESKIDAGIISEALLGVLKLAWVSKLGWIFRGRPYAESSALRVASNF